MAADKRTSSPTSAAVAPAGARHDDRSREHSYGAPTSGFTESESRGRARRRNVNQAERWVSVLGGAALTAYGIARRSPAGLGIAAVGATLLYRGGTGHCPGYASLGVNTARRTDSTKAALSGPKGVKVREAVTIAKPPSEVYRFFRDFENLPRFMAHLESVKRLSGTRSHWVAKAPAGTTVAWDAEIISEVDDKLIGWRSLEGADVVSAGSVHFESAPGGRGTEVTVTLQYDPPGGKIGAAVAKLFGEEPSQTIREDLRRLKQILETGEISTAG